MGPIRRTGSPDLNIDDEMEASQAAAIRQLPAIYQDAAVHARLEEYREQHCPGVSQADMDKNIRLGEDLERLLADPNVSVENLTRQGNATPEAAVALMWLLTAKAAQYDQLYTKGAMRLAEGEKVRDFLKACGGNNIYGRISTHMSENLGKTGEVGDRIIQADKPQMGFDLRDKKLPAGKHTVLFALQPDGSLYIKMEERGVPPFWKKGFRCWDNVKEWFGHVWTYIKTRPIIAKLLNEGNKLKSRRENVPETVKKVFKEAMQNLYPHHPKPLYLFTSQALEGVPPERPDISLEGERLYAQGKKHGISSMVEILGQAERLTPEQENAREIAIQRIASHNPSPPGYRAGVKGDEVLIPPLGTI